MRRSINFLFEEFTKGLRGCGSVDARQILMFQSVLIKFSQSEILITKIQKVTKIFAHDFPGMAKTDFSRFFSIIVFIVRMTNIRRFVIDTDSRNISEERVYFSPGLRRRI